MKEELLNKAKQSIAFNVKTVEDMNKIFSKIDPKLFAFAYYEPVPLPQTNAQACFYIAILNIYSLIWDCGPMVNSLFYDLQRYTSSISQNLKSTLQPLKNLSHFQKLVIHIRSDICHNNSTQYFFNIDAHDGHNNFLKTHCRVPSSTLTYDKEWENISDHFLDLCQDFYVKFISIVTDIIDKPTLKKEFSSLWLKYIESWYIRNSDISVNILAQLYPLSYDQVGKTPTKVTRQTIYKWVNRLLNQGSSTSKDKCSRLLSDVLENELNTYIHSSDCATPALPIPVLMNFFKQKFKTSLKITCG